MISKLAELVSGEQMVQWVICFLLLAYIAYKEWPELSARISSGRLKAKQMEETDATLSGRLDKIEQEISDVNEKLDRDYRRLNEFERWQRQAQAIHKESAEERALIMEGMLACINGIQELGAGGDTVEIRKKLNDFLIRTSHKGKE